jgi:putative flippase GtrA
MIRSLTLRLTTLAQRFQFLSFATIGVVGFLVDTSVLYLAKDTLGLGLYSGRVLSFLVAATTTWLLNRTFTFGRPPVSSLWREWLRFLSVNSVGGLVNYAAYSTLVATVPLVALYPALGVGAGSIAGLTFNYLGSKHAVFRHRAAQLGR